MLDGIENVNLIKGELIVTTDADELDIRTVRYYAMATCEASTISDTWRTVHFHHRHKRRRLHL